MQLDQTQKEELTRVYAEWVVQQQRKEVASTAQSDIVKATAAKLDIAPADVSWVFNTRYKDKKAQVDEQQSARDDLFTLLFS